MSDRKIILGLVIVQLVFCLPMLNQFPISLDEPFSIFQSQQPIQEFWQIFQNGNNSPLHFILLHGWIKLFGISAVAVRSFSVLVSLGSIIYLYKFGRKCWRQEVAVLIVGLFIFSRVNHYVAMEARMYGLFTLFFALILYDFYRLVVEDKAVYIQLGLWNALLLYTHYLGGVIVLMEILLLLFYFKLWSRKKIRKFFLATAVGVLLYLPGISLFFNRATDFQTNGTWVANPQLLDLWTNLVKLFNNELTFFTVLLIILLMYVMRIKASSASPSFLLRYFMAWFSGMYLILFLISVFLQPVFIIKYLQFLTLPLFLLIGGIIDRLPQKSNLRFLPFLILIPFVLSVKPIPDVNRNTDELVAFVSAQKQSSTIVYYCPPHYIDALTYYYNQSFFRDYHHTNELMRKEGFVPLYDHDGLDLGLEHLIYIDFESEYLYPTNGIRKTLDVSYVFQESKAFKGGFAVYIYRKS